MLELSLKDETNLVDKMIQSMGIRFFKQNIGNYLSFVTIDNLHSLAPTIFMNGRTVDNGFFSTIINNRRELFKALLDTINAFTDFYSSPQIVVLNPYFGCKNLEEIRIKLDLIA